MKRTTPVSSVLTTNCTIIEAQADIQTIREIFDHFPNRFLPVVNNLQFVGVILREEFLQKFILSQDFHLCAKDLISKEMVKLAPHNTLEEAKEIFDTKVFDVLPVTDDDGDLMGILLRDNLEAAYKNTSLGKVQKAAVNLRRIMSFFSF
ncbi:MAG TPA: CBS domain-containing protein [Bacteroidetes bacterium]|nr:CBS domain-containing protein [Bacteroidota bacterium]